MDDSGLADPPAAAKLAMMKRLLFLSLLGLSPLHAAETKEAPAKPAAGEKAKPAAEAAPTAPAAVKVTDEAAIKELVRKEAVVQGKVLSVSQTQTGSIVFINFAGVPRGGFSAVVKKADIEAVAKDLGGTDLKTLLTGKNIELSGEIELYKEKPQIVITKAKQVKILAEAPKE